MELVGYAMNEKMTKSLQALFRATASKYPDKGLIAHPDQGGQYCAHDYQDLLQQFGMVTYQWSTLLTAHLTDGCEHA